MVKDDLVITKVDREVKALLKARTTLEGMNTSEYLRPLLERIARHIKLYNELPDLKLQRRR